MSSIVANKTHFLIPDASIKIRETQYGLWWRWRCRLLFDRPIRISIHALHKYYIYGTAVDLLNWPSLTLTWFFAYCYCHFRTVGHLSCVPRLRTILHITCKTWFPLRPFRLQALQVSSAGCLLYIIASNSPASRSSYEDSPNSAFVKEPHSTCMRIFGNVVREIHAIKGSRACIQECENI